MLTQKTSPNQICHLISVHITDFSNKFRVSNLNLEQFHQDIKLKVRFNSKYNRTENGQYNKSIK